MTEFRAETLGGLAENLQATDHCILEVVLAEECLFGVNRIAKRRSKTPWMSISA
jgi:hypothetical protein